MSTPTALHEAIEKAIVDHCAGGDLWLCAHIASEPFDARIAELARERDELRARLAEYEQAPTVAWLATQQQRNPSQCVVTTKLDGWDHVELIARPTRKGEA